MVYAEVDREGYVVVDQDGYGKKLVMVVEGKGECKGVGVIFEPIEEMMEPAV